MKDYTVEDYGKALDNLVEQVELYTNYENVYMERNMLQHLVDLRTPKKVYRKNYGVAYCPICNHTADFVVNHMQYECPYCRNCGQALDWSE